jgi:hypothetical protein
MGLELTNVILSELVYGNGWSSTAWMTLNMAVLAPTPKASTMAIVAVNPGAFRRRRKARTISARTEFIWFGRIHFRENRELSITT